MGETFASSHKGDGWIECVDCPGIWKKPIFGGEEREYTVCISAHVDDCVVASDSITASKRAIGRIFESYECADIKPDDFEQNGAKFSRYDILGIGARHNQSQGALVLSMDLIIKCRVTPGRLLKSPGFEESALYCEN